MHWDRKRNKWTSLAQQRRDERKEVMSLFRKKKDETTVSAFDSIPPDVQAKLIEDALSIVRTVKSWPVAIPTELHSDIGNEVVTLLRKSGLKLAGVFLGGEDIEKGFSDAFKGVQLPNFITQVYLTVRLAIADDGPKDSDGTST